MEGGSDLPFLREIVIFLVTAAVLVPAFQWLRLSPILGFLIAGVAIGPHGVGQFADQIGLLRYAVIYDVEGAKRLGELGVVFLLFIVGLELSLERLWAMRRLCFGLGAAQIVVTAAAIGLFSWWWGNSSQTSILLGACLALSSTAIVLQLLIERGELMSHTGRAAFAVLLMQDLAVVPLLLLVGLFGAGAQFGVGLALLRALGTAAAAVLLIIGIGRLVLRPVFRLVAANRGPEPFIALTLLTIIGTAAATGAAGLSMAMGAFLAGLILADTEFRHQIKVDIEPFKGLLMGLFFLSVGMGINLQAVASDAAAIAAGVAGLMLIKTVLTSGLGRAFGLPLAVAVPVGILLAQGGEFAFVVIGAATVAGVMPDHVAQFMIVVASLTMMLTPLLAALSARVGEALSVREDQATLAPGEAFKDAEGHVIIVGYGRVGQVIAHFLDAQGIAHVGLDIDSKRVGALREHGRPVFYGDARRRQVLETMGAARAAALVVTLDDPVAAGHVVEAARKAWPRILIYVRARDRGHGESLMRVGATKVIPETSESSLQLAGLILGGLGVPVDAVERLIRDLREQDYGEAEVVRPAAQEAERPPAR